MIKACIRGDKRMHQAFYYKYYPVLMRICIRYAPGRQDAEQWVHDAFIKIFQQMDKYRFEGAFEGWLKRITARVCLDHIREKQTLKSDVEQQTIPTDWQYSETDVFVDNNILHKMDHEDILHLLKKLPEKPGVVFNLHVFEGYSFSEIAQILDIRENYVYWLMYQARKKLQNILNPISQKETNHEK